MLEAFGEGGYGDDEGAPLHGGPHEGPHPHLQLGGHEELKDIVEDHHIGGVHDVAVLLHIARHDWNAVLQLK